jgi:hypothetical protein
VAGLQGVRVSLDETFDVEEDKGNPVPEEFYKMPSTLPELSRNLS